MIYYVPIIGFIVACWRISAAQSAYFACHATGASCWAEYNATWPAFDNLDTALMSTFVGCIALVIVTKILAAIAGRKAK